MAGPPNPGFGGAVSGTGPRGAKPLSFFIAQPFMIPSLVRRYAMDFMKKDTVLNLANIRNALVRMEDTIVFALIERSQFFSLPLVYQRNKFNIPDFDGTFLEWTLLQQEKAHSQIRRFEAPDETPFFPDQILPPILPPINYPKVLANYSDEVNANNEIMDFYINDIVPQIAAAEGEQPENLGSVACCDIECLQAISRRIHFGKMVAEAKFQGDRELYTKLIKAQDAKGIEESITNLAVEAKILERLIEKGKSYGTDPSLKYSQNPQLKVDPEVIAKLYKDWIIPLTKKVEVDYLLRRLEDAD